jgi:hypothetical protein
MMLKDLFGGDTMVENIKIVPDRMMVHQGLAYGFVTMQTREIAEFYMAHLQGHILFDLVCPLVLLILTTAPPNQLGHAH